MKKRLISVFLSIFIVIGIVLSDYSTVMAVDIPTAFWGTLEYSRAFFTAMQTGGALDRGINFDDFTRSTQRQWQALAPKVMEAYQLFCFYKEKVVVAAENPDWTMEQINSEAVTRSFKLKNDFENNAIKVQNTTGKITLKDWGYWQEFCKEFSSVASNGLGNAGEVIGPDTIITANVKNTTSFSIGTSKTNVGANAFVYDDNYYVFRGNWFGVPFDYSSAPSDRVRIPVASFFPNRYCSTYIVDINRLTGEIITISWQGFADYRDFTQENVNYAVSNTNCPLYITNDDMMNDCPPFNEWVRAYSVNLAVSQGSSQALDWQYRIQEALDEDVAGSSIKKGNAAQKTKTVVREGSVPVKRSSLKEEEREGEKVVSGEIGWDIPNSKVIEGTIANPAEEDEEIKQIGVIDVQAEDIIDRPEEDDIVIPADTPIVVPEDEDIDRPVEPIPIVNIFEIQYGPFYPSAMETIGDFFPFCIPFDIYYCIQKFNVEPGEAPILHLAIPIPRQLQSRLGVTYDVNVDLNDYVLLRDIIRYFILLSFIVGLMTLTRDIIRG